MGDCCAKAKEQAMDSHCFGVANNKRVDDSGCTLSQKSMEKNHKAEAGEGGWLGRFFEAAAKMRA